jgi:cobalamin biosynthesis protein CbiG
MSVLSPPASGLVAGVGCRRDASAEGLITLIETALAQAGSSPSELALIATLDGKAEEPAVRAAATHFGVPVRAVPAADLGRLAESLPTPSPTVAGHIGLAGVAEAAVLACGELVLPKRLSAEATCALGRLAGAPQ